jgi:protein-S-isoprenylcysteine O-methyltransferase Ste14
MTTTKWLFIVFVAVVIVERALETNFSRNAMRGQKHMAWSLLAFFILHVGIITGMTVEFFVRNQGVVNVAISLVGLAMFAAAMVLRLVAIRTLDKFWSLDVEIREGHKLVRHGVYGYMRHPVYAAIILEFVGMNLVANAYWTLLATLLLYFPLLGVRLMQEEKVLIEKFGEDYRRYRQEVRALVPIRSKAS